MAVLAATVAARNGKVILSRQFIEMSRSRVEGLISSFSKMTSTGRQHTTIDTDEVRFVYQPLDDLYMVLITSKRSNILSDIDALHLFARVVEDFCRGSLTEKEISKNAFDILGAFDEIISLGYRENVNLPQIRTISEMESAEERIQEMIAKNKELEAKEESKRKMKQLEMQKREMMRTGSMSPDRGATSISVGGMSVNLPGFMGAAAAAAVSSLGGSNFATNLIGGRSPSGSPATYQPITDPQMMSMQANAAMGAYGRPTPQGRGKGMQLGRKPDMGMEEAAPLVGVTPAAYAAPQQPYQSTSGIPPSSMDMSNLPTSPITDQKPVHVVLAENVKLKANRDGGIEKLEVRGECMVRISSEDAGRVKFQMKTPQDQEFQCKTHPNVDRGTFTSSGVVTLRDASRSFPVNQSLGVLKWRWVSTEESNAPLMVNCWPNPTGSGSVDVNVEYELQQSHMELKNLTISIPLPQSPALRPVPTISAVDGHYKHDISRGVLIWTVPLVDSSNSTGQLDFTLGGGPFTEDPNAYFPVSVSFSSRNLCRQNLGVLAVMDVATSGPVDFSQEVRCETENYEFV